MWLLERESVSVPVFKRRRVKELQKWESVRFIKVLSARRLLFQLPNRRSSLPPLKIYTSSLHASNNIRCFIAGSGRSIKTCYVYILYCPKVIVIGRERGEKTKKWKRKTINKERLGILQFSFPDFDGVRPARKKRKRVVERIFWVRFYILYNLNKHTLHHYSDRWWMPSVMKIMRFKSEDSLCDWHINGDFNMRKV